MGFSHADSDDYEHCTIPETKQLSTLEKGKKTQISIQGA